VGKGGVVRDAQKQQAIINKIVRFGREHQLKQLGLAPSCLPGPKGNREFFIAWQLAGSK
jgi:23S rRNA (cytidine1920-2'-O)/16S rRNA (cytidine1409-2'-O)-methyltransferase